MIKLITFDLDNTLWHADPVIIRAEQCLYEWLKTNCPELTNKYSKESMRQFKTHVANATPSLKHKVSALRLEAIKLSLLEVGYDESNAMQQAQRAFEVFHQARQQVEFFDHSLQILNELKKNYRLAALTNGNADVSIIGLDRYFDFSLSAESVGKQKPEPDMFLIALDRANVNAEEVIHIGDHPEHDIMGASKVGFYTIWVNFESVNWSDISPSFCSPTAEANCLSEIPKLVAQISEGSFK